MKFFKCENCGAELIEKGEEYVCEYCKHTYKDDSIKAAYEKVRVAMQETLQGVVSEEILRKKNEQIANRRQSLYKARKGEFVDNEEVKYWSEEILKFLPDDTQATFYSLAAMEKWTELNRFLAKLDGKTVPYLIEDFVEFLTNGRFVAKCMLQLQDLIARTFADGSEEYKNCQKIISEAAARDKSGIFDPCLPRDVFVAYSSKDKEQVYELVEYLEENGLTCFVAMRNLAKGVDAQRYYNKRLKEAIDNCQVFVFVSSKNSRTRNCDAYDIEMAYVKERDLVGSDNPNYYNNNYSAYLESYREKCKPRVEWLVEEYGNSIYERQVKQFFCGLTWCTGKESVLEAVAEYINNRPITVTENDKLSKENEALKAELERQKSELEREKAELARRKAELDSFEIENGVLVKYKGPTEHNGSNLTITIPEGVTKIGEGAFEEFSVEIAGCPGRVCETTVVIPSTVMAIEKNAFAGASVDFIVFSKNCKLEIIDESAFSRAWDLKEITIPASVLEIGEMAFSYCFALEKVTFAKGSRLTKIGDMAFSGAPLENIEIPANVSEIGIQAFIPHENSYDVDGKKKVCLKNINVDDRNKYFTSINGNLYDKDAKTFVAYATGKLSETFEIPASVTKIAECAFSQAYNLNKVTVEKGGKLSVIGLCAFLGCESLEEIYIPATVKEIGSNTFDDCDNLTIYAEMESQPSGWENDWNPSERPVVWGYKKEEKGETAVTAPVQEKEKTDGDDDKEKSIPAPQEGEKKPDPAPVGGNKEEISAPVLSSLIVENGYRIRDGVLERFYSPEATYFEIPEGVRAIGNHAFDCSVKLKRVVIPNTVVSIGDYAFAKCKSLAKITIPDSVISIGERAFDSCEKLDEVIIGKSVRSIGSLAFLWCNALERLTIKSSNVTIAEDSFRTTFGEGCPIKNARIPTCACGKIRQDVLESAVILSGDSIDYGFSSDNLREVYIPKCVTTIKSGAFYGCPNLTIYAEVKKKPKGWVQSLFGKANWNPNNCPVVWGYECAWETLAD